MKSNFEKKYGKYAIDNLTVYLIASYVVGYILTLINPDISHYLGFDPYMIFHGQIWRLVTWLIMPPEELGFWTIIMLFLYYSLGTTLEKTWGAYRYNLYIFSGFLFTTIGMFVLYVVYAFIYPESQMIVGSNIAYFVSTFYINMTIFLAAAVVYPDMDIYVYMILPVKIKWLAVLDVGVLLFEIYNTFSMWPVNIAIVKTTVIVLSLLNFVIFWMSGKLKVAYVRGGVKRKREFKKQVKTASRERFYADGAKHKCVICGRTDETNPELTFRYCSKCSGSKEYCQDHLFTHEHK